MYKIKKINVLSLAYTIGLINLIFGIIQSLVIILAKQFPALTFLQSQTLSSLTLQQIFLYSIVAYTIGGFLYGIIIGIGYNYIVQWTGGISVSLEKDKN